MRFPPKLSDVNEQVFLPLMTDRRYVLSSFGFIYRKSDWHRMSRYVNNNGYINSDVGGCHYLIHRILAQHFIPFDGDTSKMYVNHKDGDKKNYDLSNLEWTTPSENNQHAYDAGLKVGAFLGKIGHQSARGKAVKKIDFDGNVVSVYGSARQASLEHGYDETIIAHMANKKKPYRGFNWVYL